MTGWLPQRLTHETQATEGWRIVTVRPSDTTERSDHAAAPNAPVRRPRARGGSTEAEHTRLCLTGRGRAEPL